MRVRLLQYWDLVSTSFWFVPTLLSITAIALALGTVSLDAAVEKEMIQKLGWVYRGGPEGAAGVLSAIAGSMATLAGLVFSLTLVALTLASSQFGPRLLRNFMRDRFTQFVLGTFLGAFLYCLFVLRTVRREDGSEFVPHISVTIGVVLAVVSLVMLIGFIHRLATSIQADTLVTRVFDDLRHTIDRLYPEELGEDAAVAEPALPDAPAATLTAQATGYLQAVDGDTLMQTTVEHNIVVEVLRRPGHYLLAGSPLARIWPQDRASEEIRKEILGTFSIGSNRTPTQDVEFVVNQLVEVAVRALSPGINDPFTAITCIDRLASGLVHLAHRKIPSAARLDDAGTLRVVARPVAFPEVLDTAYNQIRQYGRTSTAVLTRLLEVLAELALCVRGGDDRAAILRHAEMIERAARNLPEESDRRDVAERFARVRQNLATPP